MKKSILGLIIFSGVSFGKIVAIVPQLETSINIPKYEIENPNTPVAPPVTPPTFPPSTLIDYRGDDGSRGTSMFAISQDGFLNVKGRDCMGYFGIGTDGTDYNDWTKTTIDNVEFVNADFNYCTATMIKKDGSLYTSGSNYNGEGGNGLSRVHIDN